MTKINCILLVDDNKADNFFHTIKIKEANICNHIKIATDGTQALEYLIKSKDPNQTEIFPKPDIIYLDINMPGMNGFEFIEEFKKLDPEIRSNILIIMLTTSLNPDDRDKAKKYKEIIDYQNKPLTIDALNKTIEEHFNTLINKDRE